MAKSLVEELISAVKPEEQKKNSTYSAEVSRIDNNGVVWVYVAGSDKETPTALRSSDVEKGDTVNVEWRNNKLYIAGNVSNPAAGSIRVTAVEHAAQIANQAANNAIIDAGVAKSAADRAQAAADAIEGEVDSLSTRVDTAEQNVTALETSVSGLNSRVTTAEGDISTIEGNITTINGQITVINSDIDTIEGNVSGLNTRVSTAEGKVTTLEGKVSTAESNITNLQGRVSTAESDITTVEGNITSLQGRVTDAEDDVNATLRALGVAESVIDTINWIAEHGSMESQAGKTFDANNIYFVVDPNGDYTVGGTRYSVVEHPVASDIANYYMLSTDGSIHNYVSTHVVVDSEGLWIVPDSGGNKVLIATGGTGHTYETAGTYIVSGSTVLASFTADGAQIGQTGKSHLALDYHSMQLCDAEGNVYFNVTDLRDADGEYTAVDDFVGDGTKTKFNRSYSAYGLGTVYVNDVEVTSGVTKRASYIQFDVAPNVNDRITATYTTKDSWLKSVTFGSRREGSSVGVMSFSSGINCTATGKISHAEGDGSYATGTNSHAEGSLSTASGVNSHAEGMSSEATGLASHAEGSGASYGDCSHSEGMVTTADGKASHAEGRGVYASGDYSHAQNIGTRAWGEAQTAIGKYNQADSRNKYAFIVGNGTSETARSNALTIDWFGNVVASGDVTDGSGNVLSAKANTSSLSTVATSGSYNDLSNKPTIPTVPTNVSAFTNDAGYITDYTETDPTVPSWAKASTKPSYSANEITGLIDFFYPVGSYYETSDSTFDPNVSWGGTWYLEAEGIVHVSGGSNYSVLSQYTDVVNADDTVGQKQGGDESVTLDTTQIPAHTHGSKTLTGTFRAYQYKSWNSNTTGIVSQAANGNNNTPPSSGTNNGGATFTITATHEHNSVGGGQAHNNMQPYIPVNRWHRTA